eukprot:Sspe_Gene.90045::Locus_61675_Transcript_1_1_Confidence_1.000_Length_543::g.90045::m.90045
MSLQVSISHLDSTRRAQEETLEQQRRTLQNQEAMLNLYLPMYKHIVSTWDQIVVEMVKYTSNLDKMQEANEDTKAMFEKVKEAVGLRQKRLNPDAQPWKPPSQAAAVPSQSSHAKGGEWMCQGCAMGLGGPQVEHQSLPQVSLQESGAV